MEAVAVSHEQVVSELRDILSEAQVCASTRNDLKGKSQFLHIAATCEKKIARIERNRRELHRRFLRFLLAGFADHKVNPR